MLAKENNQHTYLLPDPLLPPKVESSNFSIFNFWQKGREVGMVNAKSQNKRGRLRYRIISAMMEMYSNECVYRRYPHRQCKKLSGKTKAVAYKYGSEFQKK